MNESFKHFVMGQLDIKWIDHDRIITQNINDEVNTWVQDGFVEVTGYMVGQACIKLTEKGKNILLMDRL